VVPVLPLLEGQQYLGRDDRADGSMTLIFDLGFEDALTKTQKAQLVCCPEVLDFTIVPDFAAPETTTIRSWK
jgi:hypothetical protein